MWVVGVLYELFRFSLLLIAYVPISRASVSPAAVAACVSLD